MSEPSLDLDQRQSLPPEWLEPLARFPRERWREPWLDQTAAHWLMMHDAFRGHQASMARTVADWRGGRLDLRGFHGRLIPELQGFLQHLDGHHRIESGHYFPAFRRAEPALAAGMDLLDRDHDRIHATLESLFQSALAFHQALLANAPDARDKAQRLAEALLSAEPPLSRHLSDEEDLVIPLLALHSSHESETPSA